MSMTSFKESVNINNGSKTFENKVHVITIFQCFVKILFF
jgi:hypothetical protein